VRARARLHRVAAKVRPDDPPIRVERAARNSGRLLDVWSVKRVFLFDAIYERVKRVTKRMTASRGAVSRGSRRASAALRHAGW